MGVSCRQFVVPKVTRPIRIARIDSNTQAKNAVDAIFTYLTPIKTTTVRKAVRANARACVSKAKRLPLCTAKPCWNASTAPSTYKLVATDVPK